MDYIRHIVSELDETGVQRCIICGEIINDYRNLMWIKEDGPPKGFAPGVVIASSARNPKQLIAGAYFNPGPRDSLTECKVKPE